MGNSSWTHFHFFRDIWSHKTSETLFVFVIFSILDLGPKKTKDLLTSPKNQFRDNFIRNRIEKVVPLNWNFSPRALKTSKKRTNPFSNLDFLPKSGFPKTRDLSPAAPRGFIFPEMTPTKIFSCNPSGLRPDRRGWDRFADRELIVHRTFWKILYMQVSIVMLVCSLLCSLLFDVKGV